MGMVTGDRVTVSATGAFTDKEVGTHKMVALSSTYQGADVGNYNISAQSNTWADITADTQTQTQTQSQTPIQSQPPSPPKTEPIDSTVLAKFITPPAVTLPPAPVRISTPMVMPLFNPPELVASSVAEASVVQPVPAPNAKSKEAKADASDDSMSSQKALAFATQTKVQTVESTTPVAAPALAPVPAAANAPTTVASVSPSAQPPSSATSGANAPATAPASAAPRSGVLPVSVLGDSRMSNMGMAYEEQPNDIRIQLTASPEAMKPSSNTIRFTGNFKTFIVNNERGEMVAYQGAMIGKRMVILAETEASKNLARQEMQTVLAAAITTLGASQSISLTQLEGVVLDLR
jgi:hypothetical protein